MKNTQITRVILEGNYISKLDTVTRENAITGYYLQSVIATYQEDSNLTIIKMSFVKGVKYEEIL